jgi:phosphoglycerate dehydrogenase-like enzyme
VIADSDARWRLAALLPLPAEAVRGFVGDLPVDIVVPETRDPAGVRAVLGDADLVLADFGGQCRIGPEELAAAPYLVFVQQPGVGVDLIDLDACAAAGVVVANTQGANDVSVAEWCLGATLDLCRWMTYADATMRRGEWPQLDLSARGATDLAGKRVGLIGFGPIGQNCARMYAAMGCPVSYWSRRKRDPEEEYGATYRDLADLLTTSDVLVVVIARAPETEGLLGAEQLATLPRGALLVNAARGHIVDEDAVASMVETGALAGAAFDVYATEPLPADSPLRKSDRIVLSPHAAAATQQGTMRVVQTVIENLRRVVQGEPVASVANGIDPLVKRKR